MAAVDLDRRVLQAAPWCWPPPGSRSRELLVERLGAVAPLRAGRVPGVTVRGQTVTLWAIDGRASADAPTPGVGPVTVGPDAQASWRSAIVALSRAVPVAWQRIHHASRELPVATFLRSHLESPGWDGRERMLDGPALGLTYVLLLASLALEEPLPPDVAAAAALDEDGALLAVDGLDRLLGGLVAMAPSLRRVIVAASQRDAALAASAGRVEILGAASAAEALSYAYGERLAPRIVEQTADPGACAELVEALLHQALDRPGDTARWSTVEQAAALGLAAWPLDPAHAELLALVRGIAERHASGTGELRLPGGDGAEAWFDAQPTPRRLALLTYLVQHSAGTGTPDARQVEALGARALPRRIRDALPPHLALMGALGRLRAITGRPGEALDLQRVVARGIATAFPPGDVSEPLGEWFRLSGILGDRASFAAAQELSDQLAVQGRLAAADLDRLAVARAAAALRLDTATPDVTTLLHALARAPHLPSRTRCAAARWLVAARRRFEGAAAAAAALAELEARAGAAEPDAADVRLAAALAALDAALAAGDVERARAIVESLRTLDPGPLGHLLDESPDPGRVARLYPL
jgi:hypothetical protein